MVIAAKSLQEQPESDEEDEGTAEDREPALDRSGGGRVSVDREQSQRDQDHASRVRGGGGETEDYGVPSGAAFADQIGRDHRLAVAGGESVGGAEERGEKEEHSEFQLGRQ